MKIAIVGGGITGITLAWLLSDLGKVVVYEKTSRLAMKHGSLAEGVTMAPTNESPELSEADAINSETAPDQITQDSENLADLDKGVPIFFPYYQADIARAFEYLGVYTEPCFPSYLSKGKFPFAMDLLPMQGFVFKRMAPFTNRRIEKDVLTVYKSLTKDYRQGNIPTNLSLRQYIRGLKLNDNSINEVIYPTIAALWSYSPEVVQDLSASKYMEFINQSKLLDHTVNDQVRYIPEGMDKYIRKLLFKGKFEYSLNNPVTKIKYGNSTINLTDSNKSRRPFDQVIITSSPEDAKAIIDPEISDWSEALSKITGHSFPTYIHRDKDLLNDFSSTAMGSSITYDLNIQNVGYHYNLGIINQLAKNSAAMMSINLPSEPKSIIYQSSINRPALDVVNTRHFKGMRNVQGAAGIYYCTDGLDHGTSPMTGGINAALMFAKGLGVDLPF